MTIENLPSFESGLPVMHSLYRMLHSYSILGVQSRVHKQKFKEGLSGFLAVVDFEHAKEASEARETYNGSDLLGNRLYLGISKVSMKHLGGASWESGRRGEHNSARDMGSALGTNFEKVIIVLLLLGSPNSPQHGWCDSILLLC